MQKVLTLTLNPAIDETISLAQLRAGQVHRADAVTFHAGGKGINVASCLADWGLSVAATGILGADNAAVFDRLFAAKRIVDKFLRIPGETRTNIKLSHDGETTDINLPGLNISATQSEIMFNSTIGYAEADSLILLAGSLPAGIDIRFYGKLITALQPCRAKIILDTSGKPLQAALNGDAMPFCIKPNRAELEYFVGRKLPDHTAMITEARNLIARGLELIVISLGAEGALFITADESLLASLPVLHATSTVGAGDAMVAGIIAALAANESLEGIARLATAFASGKLGQAGPNLPPHATIEHLKMTVKIIQGGKTT